MRHISWTFTTWETRRQSVHYAREFRDRFKGQVSSVTWRECNVIAVRSTKEGTPRLDVRTFLAPYRSRRNLLVEWYDRKMHGNVYEGHIGSAYLLAARSRSNVQQWTRVGVRRDDAVQWEPPGACRCTLRRLSIARMQPDGSISIGIFFGIYIRYNRWPPLDRPLPGFPKRKVGRKSGIYQLEFFSEYSQQL